MKHVRASWKQTGKRTCLKCHTEKPVEAFYWQKRGTTGHPHSYCKVCHCKVNDGWRALLPAVRKAKIRRKNLMATFGITDADYERMFVEQGGKCRVCGEVETFTNRKLAIDHDHQTGKVRGLLCGRCNTGIGMMRESLPLMQKAMEYLRRHGATWS